MTLVSVDPTSPNDPQQLAGVVFLLAIEMRLDKRKEPRTRGHIGSRGWEAVELGQKTLLDDRACTVAGCEGFGNERAGGEGGGNLRIVFFEVGDDRDRHGGNSGTNPAEFRRLEASRETVDIGAGVGGVGAVNLDLSPDGLEDIVGDLEAVCMNDADLVEDVGFEHGTVVVGEVVRVGTTSFVPLATEDSDVDLLAVEGALGAENQEGTNTEVLLHGNSLNLAHGEISGEGASGNQKLDLASG